MHFRQQPILSCLFLQCKLKQSRLFWIDCKWRQLKYGIYILKSNWSQQEIKMACSELKVRVRKYNHFQVTKKEVLLMSVFSQIFSQYSYKIIGSEVASVRSVKFLSHKMIWSQNRMKFSNINIASAVLIAFSVLKFCFCIQHYWISEWLHKFSITTSIFIREMQSVLFFLHITSSSHIFPSCWMYFGSLVEQNQSLHQRRAFYQLNLFLSWTLKYAKFPTLSTII